MNSIEQRHKALNSILKYPEVLLEIKLISRNLDYFMGASLSEIQWLRDLFLCGRRTSRYTRDSLARAYHVT
jgi:hypothetical protein